MKPISGVARIPRKSALVLTALLASAPVFAQTSPSPSPAAAAPPLNAVATSAEVQDLIAKAGAMPARPVIVQSLAGAGPYRVTMEYRKGPSTASVHETEGELDYVIEGSGSFVYGGTLKDSKRTNPTNLSGTGIDGGTTTRLAKGDWVVLPANTPHLTIPDDGVAVVLMTFHIPAAGEPAH